VLIGAGTTKEVVEELHREIARMGLENDVLLTGGLESGSPELIGLIQQARTFVLSSTAEPFGIVILEAWAAGTPVLSTRTSGPLTLIDHGRTGMLYDLNVPATFHQAIDAVFTDEALYRHLREEALAEVLAKYDVNTIAGRVARVYDELSRPAAHRSATKIILPKPSYTNS
jgi:glycosyltransferase involved in cell wall biosynthesis